MIPVPAFGMPDIPHDTYNGVATIFKAIARGGTGTYNYEWDFNGDGVYDFAATTTNPYDLSAQFMYPAQVSDRLFIARIRVTSGSETATAEYSVQVWEPSPLRVKVNHAIDDALWFLHVRMIRQNIGGVDIGYYPSYSLGATGMAVQAFELNNSLPNGNYGTDPYVEDVQRGLNYALYKTSTYPLAVQPAGDPDSNGNGIGLISYDVSRMYETGIVLMALGTSNAPNYIAPAGLPDTNVAGRTLGEIVQDMVDLLAFGQIENDVWRGGWRYEPNYSEADMSVTQWPVIGLEAAEENTNFTQSLQFLNG